MPVSFRQRRVGGEESESESDLANPWTVAYQAPLSMGFSRQGYWSGLPFPSPHLLFFFKGLGIYNGYLGLTTSFKGLQNSWVGADGVRSDGVVEGSEY